MFKIASRTPGSVGESRHWHSFLERGETAIFTRLDVCLNIYMGMIFLVINVSLIICQFDIFLMMCALAIIVCLVRTAHMSDYLIRYDLFITVLIIFIAT